MNPPPSHATSVPTQSAIRAPGRSIALGYGRFSQRAMVYQRLHLFTVPLHSQIGVISKRWRGVAGATHERLRHTTSQLTISQRLLLKVSLVHFSSSANASSMSITTRRLSCTISDESST